MNTMIASLQHCLSHKECGSDGFCDEHYTVCWPRRHSGQPCRREHHCHHRHECIFGRCRKKLRPPQPGRFTHLQVKAFNSTETKHVINIVNCYLLVWWQEPDAEGHRSVARSSVVVGTTVRWCASLVGSWASCATYRGEVSHTAWTRSALVPKASSAHWPLGNC